MPFIGNQLALSYTSFAKQDFTTSATTSYTLDNPVANENELALFINFVRQEPTTAYTASGTSLTLTSATSATDDMYCVYLGKAVQTVTPASGSITNAMLSSGSFSNITDVGTLASGLTLSDNILFDTASKGIYLGVTTATASNLLDDYEEGTWTPTTSQGTVTFVTAKYTKVGRLVTVYVTDLGFSDYTTNAIIEVGGLPFSEDGDQVTGSAMWSYADTANRHGTSYITGTGKIRFYDASRTGGFDVMDHDMLGSSLNKVYFIATYFST